MHWPYFLNSSWQPRRARQGSWPQSWAAWARGEERTAGCPLLSFKGSKTSLQATCLWPSRDVVHSGCRRQSWRYICGPEISELEGLMVCVNNQTACPGPFRMFVHPLYQTPSHSPDLFLTSRVFGRVPGSRDQCLPITFRSKLSSQEGAFLMIMPFGGIMRTLGLDWKRWMWDKLPLLMSPPAGGKPSTFPDPRQPDRDVGCFAHPSGIRTSDKENSS